MFLKYLARNLKTYRAKSLKKKKTDRVIFSEPAGFPPATIL